MVPEAPGRAPSPAVPTAAAARASAGGSGLSWRDLRRGGLLFSASNFVGMGLGFLTSMAMVRAATKVEVAYYLLLLQAVTALALILQLGLGEGALRFAPTARGAGGEQATRALRRRLLALQVAIWGVCAPLTVLLWPVLARKLKAPELAGAWGWLLATAMLASLSRLLDSYLRAFRFYTSSALLTHVVPRAITLGGFVAMVLAAPLEWSWQALTAVFVASQLVATVAYAACLPATTAGEASEPRAAQPAPGMWGLFTTTTPMGLRNAAGLLMTSSDLWVLSWAAGPEAVAVYGVVSRIIGAINALPLAANFLLPQEFSLLHAEGRKADLEKLARTASTAVAMLALLSFAGILLLGRPLLRIAFDESYASGWAVLLVLAIGSLWDTASGSAGYLLQMTGHQMALLRMTTVAAIANLALSVVLAPLFGMLGVAAATSLTLIGLNLFNVRAARQLVGVRTFVYTDPAEWRRIAGLLVRRLH